MNSQYDATSHPIGVLVADSSQMQSQLLVSALRRRPEFSVVSCHLDTDTILKSIASASVQVALLTVDHLHSGWQDMAVIRRIHLTHPEIAKILLVESYDRELVVNAFRSGVRGIFRFTEAPFRALCRCINRVRQGQIWVNTEQMEFLLEVVNQVPSLRVVNSKGDQLLTPREEQVVALVAEGLGNREIAAQLSLSEHTVKKYLFRIFDKLGISTRVELVLYSVAHGATRHAEWLTGSGSKH
jgi:two-component system nitrate/nitrite response regulator NarL